MEANDWKQILDELAVIRKGLPNGELKRIDSNIKQMNEDISEMKKMLLDPKEGLIVETSKNTEFRMERQAKIAYYDDQVHELDKLKEWKGGITKALWVGFTAIIGIIFKLITDSLK